MSAREMPFRLVGRDGTVELRKIPPSDGVPDGLLLVTCRDGWRLGMSLSTREAWLLAAALIDAVPSDPDRPGVPS